MAALDPNELADKYRSSVRAAIRNFLNAQRNAIAIAALTTALENGRIDDALKLLGLAQGQEATGPVKAMLFTLQTRLRGLYEEAAAAEIKRMPRTLQTHLLFDALNQRSVDFVRAYDFGLVQGIENNSRDALRTLMLDGFQQGIPPRALARDVRQVFGLTPRQTRAVANHKDMLISEGMKGDRLNRAVERYAQRQLNWRAENIARTETIRAATAGQQEVWQQAREQGFVDDDQKQFWLVTWDDRLCEVCAPIPEMNRDGVPIGGQFSTPAGMRSGPPAHPQCRCNVVLRRR